MFLELFKVLEYELFKVLEYELFVCILLLIDFWSIKNLIINIYGIIQNQKNKISSDIII